MSSGAHMSENRDCGADAAAYVLGALEPAEAEAFRRHMTSCVVCHGVGREFAVEKMHRR